MPANTVRVTLPHSDACLAMNTAGQQRWAAKIDCRTAQIYDDNGRPFGPRVPLADAGLDDDGEPNPRCQPTSIAVELRTTGAPADALTIVIPDPSEGTVTVRHVNDQPTIQVTLPQLLDTHERNDPLAPGSSALPIARLHVRITAPGAAAAPASEQQLGGTAALTTRLAEAGWCCVLNADGDLIEIVARRRVLSIDAAVSELVALGGTGSLYLDDPEQTETLAHVELGAPAHRAPLRIAA
jgi:hypothetical protein